MQAGGQLTLFYGPFSLFCLLCPFLALFCLYFYLCFWLCLFSSFCLSCLFCLWSVKTRYRRPCPRLYPDRTRPFLPAYWQRLSDQRLFVWMKPAFYGLAPFLHPARQPLHAARLPQPGSDPIAGQSWCHGIGQRHTDSDSSA